MVQARQQPKANGTSIVVTTAIIPNNGTNMTATSPNPYKWHKQYSDQAMTAPIIQLPLKEDESLSKEDIIGKRKTRNESHGQKNNISDTDEQNAEIQKSAITSDTS